MRFEVTILGSGSAVADVHRHHSAHVINSHEQFFLIDCGEATQIQLKRYGINPLKINHIFISHLHGDHVYGLFPLISTLGFMGKKTPLHIFAPHPMDEMIENHKRFFDSELSFEIIYHPVDTRKNDMIFENKTMEVYTLPLRHSLPSSGYLFREKTPALNITKDVIERYKLGLRDVLAIKNGADLRLESGEIIDNNMLTYRPFSPLSYAYCSDTSYSARLTTMVMGVTMLYHEATFGDDEKAMAKKTGHSTARQAATVAMKAQVGRLIIGHHSSRYKDVSALLSEAKEVFEETELAVEGETFRLR